MKEAELRKFATCGLCSKKIGATGHPLFYLLTIEHYALDLSAISQQQGLAMLLGGNGALALAMGPDCDVARPLMPPKKIMVCGLCSQQKTPPIMVIAEEGEQ